jgi:hypothetical protein
MRFLSDVAEKVKSSTLRDAEEAKRGGPSGVVRRLRMVE